MIDEKLAESLGFKRREGQPLEHFDRCVRRLTMSHRAGSVTSVAAAIEDACWHVDRVGHRMRIQEFKPRKRWQQLAWQWFGVKKYEPVKLCVEEFAVLVKRGEEPNDAAIREAVESLRPAGMSPQQIELHYFTVTP